MDLRIDSKGIITKCLENEGQNKNRIFKSTTLVERSLKWCCGLDGKSSEYLSLGQTILLDYLKMRYEQSFNI